MNAEILKNAGIDYDKGVKRFAGRAYIYEKTLAKFSRDTTFSRISAAYEADDMEQMFASAHELKGVCGNIALTELYDISSELTELLRGGQPPAEKLAAGYERLKSKYGEVYEALTAAMEEQA